MGYFRKAFLIFVGALAVAYEETEKTLNKTAKNLEERRERLGGWSRRQI